MQVLLGQIRNRVGEGPPVLIDERKHLRLGQSDHLQSPPPLFSAEAVGWRAVQDVCPVVVAVLGVAQDCRDQLRSPFRVSQRLLEARAKFRGLRGGLHASTLPSTTNLAATSSNLVERMLAGLRPPPIR